MLCGVVWCGMVWVCLLGWVGGVSSMLLAHKAKQEHEGIRDT